MNEMIKKENGGNLATVERTRSTTTYTPRFDIVEVGDELTLYGDLPGVAPENLEVRFENDHLIVHGRVEPRHEDRQHLYSEYGIGDFYREFRINEAVDVAKIEAELKDGVLTLHLPKVESIKPKRIEVKSE